MKENDKNQKAFEEYCRELARTSGIPEHTVKLLAQIDTHAERIQQLLMEVEEQTAIEDLTDEDGMSFSELAWDYAKENWTMPLPELISILGQFHGKGQTDNDEGDVNPLPFDE